MKRLILLCFITVLAGLTGCGDYSNRVYRYHDEIPLRPFVLQLTQTEYGLKDGKVVLKISLHVTNKSPEKNNLSRNRFTLRVGPPAVALAKAGPTREVTRDLTFLENLGIETVSFGPGEDAVVKAPFVLEKDALDQPLALIVDRQEKNGKERLTLIEVKKSSPPKNPPVEGEWRTTRSARWE